ncbi:MAG: hypothetical protein BMS9Abin26_2126 [Gammaproteobacteria bacterium]|nr:MAG: hypothetical protein BMS9Abin26_2126 [Gammaproteobacteria bacterium]
MELFLTRDIKQQNQPIRWIFAAFIGAWVFLLPPGISQADIPFRVSVKFIVDASDNRPATGRFNTTAEVNAEANAGNDILKAMKSELRLLNTEIIDLPTSLSAYSTIAVSSANVTVIRNLALADPVTWRWRTNAVNVYVTGGPGSAYSRFPPENDIILFGQGCTANPSCLLHELGHSLNLSHTQAADDGCTDTLTDDSSWNNKDQMANANYGDVYANLTAGQQYNVDMTWSNFMSYHVVPPQDRFTPCQKDRSSSTASSDSSWWLTKQPVYVHPANSGLCSIFGICNGTWSAPYPNFQAALNSGGLAGKVIVLEQGNYVITQAAGINLNVEINTRQGTSRVDRGVMTYELPVAINNSKNSAVSTAAKSAQDEDRKSRKVIEAAQLNTKAAITEKARATIMANAEKQRKVHKDNAIKYLLQAEKHAAGNEKLAIQMELAERYWHSGNYQQSLTYYTRVADKTDQPGLKDMALLRVSQSQEKIAAGKKSAPAVTPETE